MPPPQEDEELDLVDADDRVVGKMWRSHIYAEGRRDFRVVNVFIRNSAGALWIPRRGPHKRIFPNALDMSTGEHVQSGEDYDTAFVRGLREELHMDAQAATWRVLGDLRPEPDGVHAFMRVYEITSDTAPAYNPADFVSAEWIMPNDLLARIESGDPSKEDLPILVRRFYS